MYQSGYAMPMPSYGMSANRTSAFGDYFRGLSLVAWLFLLIVSFWWLAQWDDYWAVNETGIARTMQYLAVGVVFAAHLTLGIATLLDQSIQFWTTVKGRMLGGFCLLMLATSPLSIDPLRSALYSIATFGVFMICFWAWQMDYDRFRRVMLLAAVVLFAFLLLLIVHHGMSRSSIGGINRNRIGQTALTAGICTFLYRGKLKWVGMAGCFGFALLVNSRGTLLAAGVFTGTYLFLKFGLGRSLLAMMGMALAGALFLAVPSIGQRTQEKLVDDVIGLHDQNRGLGSGFSGRLETWQNGLAAFWRSPAIGHGFRTRALFETGDAYLAHSGYVNLLADAGLVGAALVIGALVYDFLQRFRAINVTRRMYGGDQVPPALVDTFELNCVICSFLAAESLLWLYEPLYLNLGASLSILFVLLVMAPQSVSGGAARSAWSMAALGAWPYQRPAEGWA
jgi:O-antigen ligase